MRRIKNIFKKAVRKNYPEVQQPDNATVDPQVKYHKKDSTAGLLLKFDNRPYVSILNPSENK